ncbi:MAG TPA: PRC-barrel domain-containing protein [Bryobacteraceae bacterium]|nr:PRC-barrel domain-containing protein [Bryobacteraceae bacterium]
MRVGTEIPNDQQWRFMMKLTMFAALLGTTALIPLGAMAQSSNPASQPNANQQAGQAQQNLSLVVSQMRNQTLFSQSGQEIGRITRVVQGRDNQTYAVVAAGNGEVLIPSSRLAHQNNRLMMTGANDLPRLQTYNQQSASQYRDVDPNVRVAIVAFAVDPSGTARPTGDGSRIVLQQAAPTIRVDPADPRVTVRQAQPQVTVNQAQPEIIVRQPQPTVRVDIPQPEIIVRMPQPDVSVALAQPQVRVNSAPPQVQVVQPPQQPQVQVEQSQPQVLLQRSADMEPNVQVQQAEGQPTVRYELSEPRVIVNQAQGQPNVRIERMDQNQKANAQAAAPQGQPAQQQATVQTPLAQAGERVAQQSQARAGSVYSEEQRRAVRERVNAGDAETTASVDATAPMRPVLVSALEDMNVYNGRGEELGEVDRVIVTPQGRRFLVVGAGGFLGIGRDRVAFPLERFGMRGDRLVIRGVTEDDIDAMDDYRDTVDNFQRVSRNEQAELRVWQ